MRAKGQGAPGVWGHRGATPLERGTSGTSRSLAVFCGSRVACENLGAGAAWRREKAGGLVCEEGRALCSGSGKSKGSRPVRPRGGGLAAEVGARLSPGHPRSMEQSFMRVLFYERGRLSVLWEKGYSKPL